MVELGGFLGNNTGAGIACASVVAFPDACNATETTAVGANSTTTTDANGYWTFSALAANKYDIRITSGTSVRWRRYFDEWQGTTFQLGDDGNAFFGNANDAGLRWSTGDCDNHALVLAVGQSNQVLHIAELCDIGVDWNVAANAADSEVWIHSSTTPATDYLKIGGHDGTTALLDVVGGTTLAFLIAGNTELTINASGLNVPSGSDILFTGTTGTNDINLVDCVADALSIVRGSTDFMVFNTCTPSLTITPNTIITGTVTGATGSVFGNLTLADGSITDSSGAITFVNENLSTTGTLASGALTVTGAVAICCGAFTFNECSNDHDARFEGANNANLITMDAGTDSLAFGSTVVAGAFIDIEPGAQARDMITAVGLAFNLETDSTAINAAGNGETVAVGAAIHLGVQTYTSVGTCFVVTDLSTFHIVGEPVDSTNVTGTRKYSALIETGSLGLGIPGGSGATMKWGGSTSGIVTMQVAAAAGTWTWTLPVDDGAACQFLQTNGSGVTAWAAAPSGKTTVVRKTSSTTITCDSTLTADPELKVAIAACEVRAFKIHLNNTEGNTTADFKAQVTFPACATTFWTITVLQSSSLVTTIRTSGCAGVASFCGAQTIQVEGIVVNASNAGCIGFNWAQVTSNCGNTTVAINSYMAAWTV